jgi:hypothetical protein
MQQFLAMHTVVADYVQAARAGESNAKQEIILTPHTGQEPAMLQEDSQSSTAEASTQLESEIHEQAVQSSEAATVDSQN